MKRRLRRLIVFAGVLGVLMVLNVGAALAVHDGPAPAFDDAEDNNFATQTSRRTGVELNGPPADASLTPGAIPVGSALLPPAEGEDPPPGNPGSLNGFDPRPLSGAVVAIAKNPNCPAHYAP
jgi:hypothetical protein